MFDYNPGSHSLEVKNCDTLALIFESHHEIMNGLTWRLYQPLLRFSFRVWYRRRPRRLVVSRFAAGRFSTFMSRPFSGNLGCYLLLWLLPGIALPESAWPSQLPLKTPATSSDGEEATGVSETRDNEPAERKKPKKPTTGAESTFRAEERRETATSLGPVPVFRFEGRHIKSWMLLGPIPQKEAPENPLDLLKDPRPGKSVELKPGLTRIWKRWDEPSDAVQLLDFCKQEQMAADHRVVYAAVELVSDKPDRQIFVAMDDGARAWVDGQLRVNDVSAGWISQFEHPVHLDFSKKKRQWLVVEVHNVLAGFQLMVTQGNTIRGEIRYPDGRTGVPDFGFGLACGNKTLRVDTNGHGEFLVRGAPDASAVALLLDTPVSMQLEAEGPLDYRLKHPVRLPNLRRVAAQPIAELDSGNYGCFAELPDGRLLLFERIRKKFLVFDGGLASEIQNPAFQDLKINRCSNINITPDDAYWLTTDNDVVRIRGNQIESWSNKQIGGTVNHIHLDKKTCWVGHSAGLTRIDRHTGTIEPNQDSGIRNVLDICNYHKRLVVVYEQRIIGGKPESREEFGIHDGYQWKFIKLPQGSFGRPLCVDCDEDNTIIYVGCQRGVLAYHSLHNAWRCVFLTPHSDSMQMCRLHHDQFLAVNANRTAFIFQNGHALAQSRLQFAIGHQINLRQRFSGEALVTSSSNGVLRLRLPLSRRLTSLGQESAGVNDVHLSSVNEQLLISPSNAPAIQGNLEIGFDSIEPLEHASKAVSELRLPEPARMLAGPRLILAVPHLSGPDGKDQPDPSPPVLHYPDGTMAPSKRPVPPTQSEIYYCALTTSDKRFLLGTSTGLWELKGTTFEYATLFPDCPVPKIPITAILEDGESFWAGTDGNQLLHCTRDGTERIPFEAPLGQSIRTTSLASYNGQIIAGTTDGLFVVDPSKGVVKRSDSILSHMLISDLVKSHDDERLIIATLYRGMFQMHPCGAVAEFLDVFEDHPPIITSLDRHKEDLWIGSSDGVHHYRATSTCPRLFVSRITLRDRQISLVQTNDPANLVSTEFESLPPIHPIPVRQDELVTVTLASVDDNRTRLFEYRTDDGPWKVAGSSKGLLEVPLRFPSTGNHDVQFCCMDSDGNRSAILHSRFHAFIPFWDRRSVHIASAVLVSTLSLGLFSIMLIYWRSQIAARRAAEQATRERDALMERVCHDLRSPIGVASVCTDILSYPESDRKSMIELLGNSVESMQHLSNQLLLFCRSEQLQESNPEPLEISRFLDQIKRATLLTTNANDIALHIYIDPNVSRTLQIDGNLLREVLNNLLNNAYRHTTSGDITVSCDRAPGGGVRFQVSDSGCGMNEEALKNVFIPYYRSDHSPGTAPAATGQNMGLGLAICQNLMNAMGGSISIASQPSVGTTISLLFPPKVELLPSAVPSRATAQARKVVVVDDVESFRNSISSRLISKGHDVMTCDENLSISDVLDFAPDVVITDLGMPVTDGFDVARNIREKMGEATHIVGMTESEDLLNRAQSELSFDHVVDKTQLSDEKNIDRLLAQK